MHVRVEWQHGTVSLATTLPRPASQSASARSVAWTDCDLEFVLMFALALTHSHPDTHHVFCFFVAAGKGGARSVTSSRAVSVLAARARSRCLSSTCALHYQRQSSAQPTAPAFQHTLTFRLTCVQKSPGSRPRWPSGGSSPLPLLDLPVPALLQMGPGSPPPLSPGYVVPLML